MFENMGGTGYQAIVVRMLLPYEKPYHKNTQREALIKGLEIVRKNLQKDGKNVLLTVREPDIYCVMSGNEKMLNHGVEYLRKVKVDLIKLAEIFSGLKVWIAVGKRVLDSEEIICSVRGAEEALLERFLKKNQEILTVREETVLLDEKDFVWNMEKERLLNSMEVLDVDRIQADLETQLEQVQTCRNLTGKQVKSLYWNIITTFHFGIHRLGIELSEQAKKYSPEQRFEQSNTVEELFEELKYYIVDGLREWEALKNINGREKKQILKAKQYINKFYYMPLTLEEVSDYVGFNASYFSSIFKKEMNQSFSEYLTEIRMRYAKQMILNEDIGTTEVAERVGYNDKKYFAKVFKKNTGLTPYEYKKIYR